MTTLEKILLEIDKSIDGYPDNLNISDWKWFIDFLNDISNIDFIVEAFEKAVKSVNYLRILLFLNVFQGDVHVKPNHKKVYLSMMRLLIDCCQSSSFENLDFNEEILYLVLDLFWHHDTCLESLNEVEQIKFKETLECVSNYNFKSPNENLFFAISKSMDLIKFQAEYGDSPKLINLYLNHFHHLIRERALEYSDKGWL